jgi:hypothetical protein
VALFAVIAGVAACGAGGEPLVVGDVEAPELPASTTVLEQVEAGPSSTQGATPTSAPTASLAADQPVHDGCREQTPPEPSEVPSQLLVLESTAVQPGDSLTYRWNPEEPGPVTVGDDLTVWCWNGVEWVAAWAVFLTFTDPITLVLTPDLADGYSFTADGWAAMEGQIPIPPEAPPGTYRIIETISVGAGPDATQLTGEARFAIELPDS